MSYPTVIVATSTAVAINTVVTIAGQRDPFPQLLAGGAMIVALTLLNEANADVASALAVLFLASTILLRGKPFFDWVNALITPKG